MSGFSFAIFGCSDFLRCFFDCRVLEPSMGFASMDLLRGRIGEVPVEFLREEAGETFSGDSKVADFWRAFRGDSSTAFLGVLVVHFSGNNNLYKVGYQVVSQVFLLICRWQWW